MKVIKDAINGHGKKGYEMAKAVNSTSGFGMAKSIVNLFLGVLVVVFLYWTYEQIRDLPKMKYEIKQGVSDALKDYATKVEVDKVENRMVLAVAGIRTNISDLKTTIINMLKDERKRYDGVEVTR